MRIFEYKLVVNQSMGANFTSPSQLLNQMAMGAVQAVWTGAPVGTMNLEMSNDNVNWSTYTGSATAVSGAGNFTWNLASIGFYYLRVVYVFTSGSGTLNVTIIGKGV